NAGPAYRIIVGKLMRDAGVAPREVDQGISTGHHRGVFQLDVAEIFTFQAMLLARLIGIKSSSWNHMGHRPGKPGALHVGDFRLRKARADSGENGYRLRR